MIRCDDKWFKAQIQKHGGIFDKPSFEMCMKHIDHKHTAIDCGAHIGSWTLGLSNMFEHVYAFEPFSYNYTQLVHNTKDKENVKVFNYGLSNKHEDVSFTTGANNSGQSHVVYNTDGTVKLISLDDILSDIEECSFIKFDVEGYEYFALEGAATIIQKFKPVIMVELNGLSNRYNKKDQDVIDLLVKMGYTNVDKQNKDYLFKCI